MTSTELASAGLRTDRRQWLARMLLIRRFEEVGEDLSLRGKIPAGIHPSTGQEGVAVGVMSALHDDDPIASTHRSHHHALARGTGPDQLMAELFGRATGTQAGRVGSMHVADPPRANFGGNGIVGAGVGLAMGVALGIHLAGDAKVSVGFVGDGGANTGRVWESVNLAVVWRLPLIVVVENNLYAVETHIERMLGGGSISERARGFGIQTRTVDGQDVEAVHQVAVEAAQWARGGEGPFFVEALTYRYRGHGSGERANYRTSAEIEDWRSSRDPIERLANQLRESGELTGEAFEQLRLEASARVDAAVAYAEDSPWPDPATAGDGVDLWPSYEKELS